MTLLGASGNSPRNPLLRSARVDGCVTITEEPAACGGKRAWYRVVSEAPGSGRCPAGRRRSESGKFCLQVIDPVEVDVDVDIPPLRTR